MKRFPLPAYVVRRWCVSSEYSAASAVMFASVTGGAQKYRPVLYRYVTRMNVSYAVPWVPSKTERYNGCCASWVRVETPVRFHGPCTPGPPEFHGYGGSEDRTSLIVRVPSPDRRTAPSTSEGRGLT